MADAPEKDPASRTEEPTPRRREEARAEGQIPRSVEVTSTAVLLAAAATAAQAGESGVAALRALMRRSLLALTATDLTPGAIHDLAREAALASLAAAGPVLALTALVALAASLAQVGFQMLPKRVKPDPSKLSPAAGLRRILSRRGLVELAKAVVKIALVGWIAWRLVRAAESRVVALAAQGPAEILGAMGAETLRLVAWAVGALALVAALDYAWQRWQHQQSLRMTRTEVKEERRQAEGDPHVRQRVKQAYQQLARRRGLAEVATADVVVTNPVHVAVALRYVPGGMGAPTVVAKGAERVAERIKTLARRHGVPIVERRALARLLFRTVPVGREIPATLYRAVAEILAYIYALRARRAG
jgi:flagellar biosynthetic protein FlhB